MGKRTVYTCDKAGCSAESEEPNAFWQVQALPPGPVTRTVEQDSFRQMHLCKACYASFTNWLAGLQLAGKD